MRFLAALCWILSQEGIFTPQDAEDALRRMRQELENASIEKRIAAVQEALRVEHEKVIRAMTDLLVREPNPVRIAIARGLAEVDHPVSVEVLLKALPANQNRAEVMPELLKALGTLGYQSACPVLHDYLRKVGDDDVRVFLPEVIETLGQLGNPLSIEPLVDLLRKMEGPRRAPWPNEGILIRAVERALRAITGQDFRRAQDWENYWKQNAEFLKAGMTRTYWLRKTQERIDVSGPDKAPADSVLVAVRIVPPPAAPTGDDNRRALRRNRRR